MKKLLDVLLVSIVFLSVMEVGAFRKLKKPEIVPSHFQAPEEPTKAKPIGVLTPEEKNELLKVFVEVAKMQSSRERALQALLDIGELVVSAITQIKADTKTWPKGK